MAEREQQTAHVTHDADVHLWRDQRGRLTLCMAALDDRSRQLIEENMA